MKQYLTVLIVCILFLTNNAYAQIEIAEIAWMGTSQSANDEWIELHNTSSDPVIVDGWVLEALDETPTIHLAGTIAANNYFLLERTNDETVPGVSADLIYVGALGNSGEMLTLKDALGNPISRVPASDGWPAGDNETKETMQWVNGTWITAPATPKTSGGASAPPPVSVPEPEPVPPPPPPEIIQTSPPPISVPEIESPHVQIVPEQNPIIPPPVIPLQTTSTPPTIIPHLIVQNSPKKVVEKKKKTKPISAISQTAEINLAAGGYTIEKPETFWESLWRIPQRMLRWIQIKVFHRGNVVQ